MRKDVKGKKRAIEEVKATTDSSLSPPPPEEPQVKRSKKGETRPCPVCEDDIPLRLLAKHADFELQRVENILFADSTVAVFEPEAGPSTGRRGAALKARKSLSALSPRTGPNLDSLEQADKTIKILKRNRKHRHTKLREILAQEDVDCDLPRYVDGATACPVCLTLVRGGEDVVDAHINTCVEHASRLQAEAEERDARERYANTEADGWEEYSLDGETQLRVINGANLRGTGFHVRDRNQRDVEEEVDVDGDDEDVFGNAQFTERDVLAPATGTDLADGPSDPADETDEGNADERRSLRELVAEGKIVTRRAADVDINGVKAEMEEIMGLGDTDRMDKAVSEARRSGNKIALISALQNKVKQLESMRVSSSTSLLCRICLDPYNEPTTSTGCWHTCCRECWLRCLGSTKLCPMCKRITAATELRRIYM